MWFGFAPINLGGVYVRSGDIVVGDEDGVVVVPIDIATAVLVTLGRIRVAEAETIRRVDAGLTLSDAAARMVAAARIIGG